MGRTRSSVLGRWSRLGLSNARAAPLTIVEARAAEDQGPLPPGFVLTPRPQPAKVLGPRPWLTRTLLECAYPVSGDGADTMSCCDPVLEGQAYCKGHYRMTHVKPNTTFGARPGRSR